MTKVLIYGCVVWFALRLTADAQNSPKYVPLGSIGKSHFPVGETKLLALRDLQDVLRIRNHAWELFAGLTGSDDPIWNTWYTKCDVHLLVCADVPQGKRQIEHKVLRGFELPAQDFAMLQGHTPSLGGLTAMELNPALIAQIDALLGRVETPTRFANVLYNRPAAEHIRMNKLYLRAQLNTDLKFHTDTHSPKPENEVPPFPNDSVVLKFDWEKVRVEEDGLTQLLSVKNRVAVGGQASPPRNIRIDPSPKRPCSRDDYDPDTNGTTIVPISCFYAIRIDPRSVDWQLLENRFSIPYDDAPYYLVMIALHVTTKETPDWVWATFWWNNHISGSPYACDVGCKKILRGANWRHFLMDTTLSDTTPFEVDHGRGICFNPYLEESFLDSNCIQCHRRATYTFDMPDSKEQCGYTIGSAKRCSLTGEGPLKPCSEVQPACDDSDSYFKNTLQTDMLWTIPHAQNTSFQQLMELVRRRFILFQANQAHKQPTKH